MDLLMPAGMNTDLPAHVLSGSADVMLSCLTTPGIDLDIAAIAVGADGRVLAEEHFVFFNNPRDPFGAVQHLGQREAGGRSWDALRVELGRLPAEIVAVHVTVSGEHDGLSRVPGLRAEIVDQFSDVVARIALDSLRDEGAAVLLEFYRRAGTWKVRAVAQGWDTGFAGMVQHFGVQVGEQPEASPAAAAPTAPAPTAPAPSAPAPSAPHLTTPAAATTPRAVPGGAGESSPRRGLFGVRKRELQDELDTLRRHLQEIGAMDALEIARSVELRRRELAGVEDDIRRAREDLRSLRAEIVEVDEIAMLQQAGIYDFAHPLETSVAHKDRIKALKERYKALTKNDAAISATTSWNVNGSAQQGAKMVKDTSRLMLRAYNAEADNCVRVVRPHSLATNLQRLEKAKESIAKLGSIMSIRITDQYHRARLDEIKLTADYHAKVEQEREEQRAARERAREDRQAEQELARERERLDRERAKVERALEVALQGSAETESVEHLREKLATIDTEMEQAELRAANARMGFVYVISNLGAFGPEMVKIGMTRRREPLDRVRELGDASVPFLFDVHALIFSEDALGLEAQLHAAFAHRRVNRINMRREFFHVTPSDVRDELVKLKNEHLLDFTEEPLADEWRRSRTIAAGIDA